MIEHIRIVFKASVNRRSKMEPRSLVVILSFFADMEDLKNENFDYKDWKSRFLSTLEWFSSLVNNNEIPFKLAKRFFKESIIEWYNQFLLSEPDKEDPNKYDAAICGIQDHDKSQVWKLLWNWSRENTFSYCIKSFGSQ